jgi:hypothetical protein
VDSFQRWNQRREDAIHGRTVLLPVLVVSLHNQIGLGWEEMIETTLIDSGTLANIVHADGTVAAIPNEIESHLEQLFFSFARLFHIQHRWPYCPNHNTII